MVNRILNEDIESSQRWYRIILNICWAAVMTIVFFILIQLLFYTADSNRNIFISDYFVLSTLLISFIIAVEALSYFWKIRNDYLLIILGITLASTLVWVNPDNNLVILNYYLPIFISALLLKRDRIVVTGILCMASFILIHLSNPVFNDSVQDIDYYSSLAIILWGSFFSLIIARRGEELLLNLQRVAEAKQELMVRNVIMDKLSKIDPLTQLYNHRTFHEYLDRLVEQSEKNDLLLQLAILDIDDFKKVNDTYGHWVGDLVLVRVASAISELVTPNDFVTRYGGEEFSVIFTEKSLEQSYNIMELIRLKIANTLHEELANQAVTVSIGIKNYHKGEGKEALFKGADSSLYTAKKTGKNRIVEMD